MDKSNIKIDNVLTCDIKSLQRHKYNHQRNEILILVRQPVREKKYTQGKVNTVWCFQSQTPKTLDEYQMLQNQYIWIVNSIISCIYNYNLQQKCFFSFFGNISKITSNHQGNSHLQKVYLSFNYICLRKLLFTQTFPRTYCCMHDA